MLLYLTVAFVALMLALSAAVGWNSVHLGWGSAQKGLRRYLFAKFVRLGLLLCSALALTAASVPIARAVEDDWAIGATIATLIVPPLAAVCIAVLWWIGELAGNLAFRSTTDSRSQQTG